MYGTEGQSVLRCAECNKPFDKESTLKRHRYYCRSRKDGTATRSRSCISCASAKARCDDRRPECSRCLSKAIRCQYPAQVFRQLKRTNQHHDITPTELQNSEQALAANTSNLDTHNGTDNHYDGTLHTAFDIADLDFTDVEDQYFNLDINSADFLKPRTYDQDFQHGTFETASFAQYSITPNNQTTRKHNLYYPYLSIQTMPIHSIRSFNQRPKLQTSTQRIANLILHTLKSYPLMMLRDKTLPPFIHPHLISSDIDNNDVEALINCTCLVQMLNIRMNVNRTLFWKNVRMECDRLLTQHLHSSRWELLAAMQALSIYILIRVEEGETEHNNIDTLLITTVIAVATQFNKIYTDVTRDSEDMKYNSPLEARWKNWILEESARRLCVVYQVVNMLVYFEPAAMCDLQEAGLLLAPLPMKKQLWEARDEFAWRKEAGAASDSGAGVLEMAFGLSTNGDLVTVDDGPLYCGDDVAAVRLKTLDERQPVRKKVDWEEWCAGMDGFGSLVMLAASLVA